MNNGNYLKNKRFLLYGLGNNYGTFKVVVNRFISSFNCIYYVEIRYLCVLFEYITVSGQVRIWNFIRGGSELTKYAPSMRIGCFLANALKEIFI